MDGAMTVRFTTQAQSDIRRITSELAELQAQIASTKKATDLRGYGTASTHLLTAAGMKATVDARGSVIDQLGARFEIQAASLNQAASSTRGLALSIRQAISAGDGRGISTELGFAFSSVVSAMNQAWNGQPLFAGERQNGAPVTVTTLDGLAAAPSTSAIFDEAVRPQVLDLGDGSPIQLSGKASDISSGAFEAMRQLKQLVDAAGGAIGQPIDSATATRLLNIVGQLEASATTITNEEGRTGRLQANIEEERTRLTRNSDLLSKEIGEQSDADMAQVSIKLNVLMAQYEAAAKTFSDLSKLTLLKYL